MRPPVNHEIGQGFGRGVFRFKSLLSLGCAACLSLLTLSCGSGSEFNLFGLVSKPTIGKTKVAKTEEAKVLLDNKDYDGALALVEPMIQAEKLDSNEARLLYAAATLGKVKLDVWSLISSFLSTQTSSNASNSSKSGGIDSFLDTVTTSIFGTADETKEKSSALSQAISVLEAAPDPEAKAIINTSCFFGAILAVPTFTAAKNAVTATTTALETIQSSATSGGESCPDIALLDTALSSAQTAVDQFSAVLRVAGNCSFLNTGDTATQINSIEKQLAKIKAGADKGCSGLPSCPASFPNCQSLFPTCVQKTLSSAGGTAGDGLISSCELTRNCIVGGDCF
jgi:hypothetical protein